MDFQLVFPANYYLSSTIARLSTPLSKNQNTLDLCVCVCVDVMYQTQQRNRLRRVLLQLCRGVARIPLSARDMCANYSQYKFILNVCICNFGFCIRTSMINVWDNYILFKLAGQKREFRHYIDNTKNTSLVVIVRELIPGGGGQQGVVFASALSFSAKESGFWRLFFQPPNPHSFFPISYPGLLGYEFNEPHKIQANVCI